MANPQTEQGHFGVGPGFGHWPERRRRRGLEERELGGGVEGGVPGERKHGGSDVGPCGWEKKERREQRRRGSRRQETVGGELKKGEIKDREEGGGGAGMDGAAVCSAPRGDVGRSSASVDRRVGATLSSSRGEIHPRRKRGSIGWYVDPPR